MTRRNLQALAAAALVAFLALVAYVAPGPELGGSSPYQADFGHQAEDEPDEWGAVAPVRSR